MDPVKAQYEAYPYPERDPRDEAKRLITGSPSWPQEMDHWLWGGSRDWSKTLKILVAGGGTGDGLIQLAQMMTSAKRPYDITYLDLSQAARQVAEARAKVRGLTNIKFVTERVENASDYGLFDYIDCCGVLHHLPEPQAGFNALAQALAPGGGIGLMVYAPLGRAGVYPLQNAFNTLGKDRSPKEKFRLAKQVFSTLPDAHPFKSNPHLVDHKASDAGFYDLLLHSTDRPFTITELVAHLNAAGLDYVSSPEPKLYDPSEFLSEPVDLDNVGKMQVAEDLRGSMKTHIAYATHKGAVQKPTIGQPNAIPHIRGIDIKKLSQAMTNKGKIKISTGATYDIPKLAGRLISAIDGRRSLAEIQSAFKLDIIAFRQAWLPLETALCGHGIMHYSSFLK